MRVFNKFICLLFILILLCSSLNNVFAQENNKIRISMTNFQTPIIGQAPSFDYDVVCTDENNNSFNEFTFLFWLELDLSIEETHEMIATFWNALTSLSNSSVGTPPEFENQDYYDEKLKSMRILVNENSSKIKPEDILAASLNPEEIQIGTIDTFLPNKTYLALFEANSQANIGSTGNGSVSTEPASSIGLTFDNDLDLSINGSTNNVKGGSIKANTENLVLMYALYNAVPPSKDFTVTIKWDSPEDKIPDSMILKLLNGNEIIREHIVSKSNAVKDGVWEYTFEGCPIKDENNNDIIYTLAYEEANKGDLNNFSTVQDGFIIHNIFTPPELNSKIKMTSHVDREQNNVKYIITYNSSVEKYSGNADVLLTTTLPFGIDEAKSNLDGGTYDDKTKTITWKDTINDINQKYNYTTTKEVDLYATAVLPYNIETKTLGKIQLATADNFSETVDITDIVEAPVENPKTGDIDLVKYASISSVAIAAILMVIQIKRKYSTKKNKILF